MPTKAQIQEKRDQLQTEFRLCQQECQQVQRVLDQLMLALQVTERDLQRKIDFVSDAYDETGSELAERFEQGMKLALERIRALQEVLEKQHSLDWADHLWREGTGE